MVSALAWLLLLAQAPATGPAFVGGLGHEFAGAGVQALYYAPPLPGGIQVVPRAGLAFATVVDPRPVPFSAGLALSVGARHRAVADGGVVLQSVERLVLHGTTVKHRAAYAVTAAAGWEYVVRGDAMMRVLVGWFWSLDDTLAPDERGGLTGSLGFGWKL